MKTFGHPYLGAQSVRMHIITNPRQKRNSLTDPEEETLAESMAMPDGMTMIW